MSKWHANIIVSMGKIFRALSSTSSAKNGVAEPNMICGSTSHSKDDCAVSRSDTYLLNILITETMFDQYFGNSLLVKKVVDSRAWQMNWNVNRNSAGCRQRKFCYNGTVDSH